jgi:hypothetical protein
MASQSFQLVLQKGPNPGKIFELVQDELTIGRDISNRIVINDPEVSRRHARMTSQAGGYVIEDLGSTNGTFVDGQRLMGPHLLRPGQTIMFGEKITLTYEAMGYDPNATISGPVAGPPVTRQAQPAAPDYGAVYAPAARPPEAIPPAYQPPAPPTYQPPAAPAYQPPAAPAYQPPAAPAYPQQPTGYPAAAQPAYSQPAYSGQVPSGPVETYAPAEEAYEETEQETSHIVRNVILAGCGVLIIMMCCLVVGVLAFDTLDMYCQPPFNSLSGILWYCP